MTSSAIYHGGTAVATTVATGYADFPGVTGNVLRYDRAILSSLESLEFVVHLRPDAFGAATSFCGWAGAYASFLYNSANALQMYFRSSPTRSLGNAASPSALPTPAGTWVWVRGKVTRATANCEYWYSTSTAYPSSWISLGSAIGSYANDPFLNTNSDQVYIGQRGSTTFLDGRIDYFAEWDDGVKKVEVDLRNVDVLPANTTLVAGGTPPATFVPRVRQFTPVKKLYIGSQQVYPLSPSLPKMVDLYKGDTRVWPGAEGYVSNFDVANNYLSVPTSTRWDSEIAPGFTVIACIRKRGAWVEATRNLYARPGTWNFYTGMTGWGDLGVRLLLLVSYNAGSQFYWRWSDPLPDYNGWLWLAATYDPTFAASTTRIRFWLSYDGVNWNAIGSQSGSTPADAMSVNSNPLELARATPYDHRFFSIRKGFGADGTVVANPGANEIFRVDRNSFKVGRRAATIQSAQTDIITLMKAGSPQLSLYPTVSEMTPARWGVSQYADDTKWAS